MELTELYRQYLDVRRCYESRVGYAAVYVTDVEMEQAREQATAIEAAILKADPLTEKDQVWQEAATTDAPAQGIENTPVGGFLLGAGREAVKSRMFTENGQSFCGHAKYRLSENYEATVPRTERSPRKDF